MVMDYTPTDMDKLLAEYAYLTEKAARFYATEIILAIEELHINNIVYRHLNLDNVELDEDGHVKISNTGLAKIDVHTASQGGNSYFESLGYLPPEAIEVVGHGKAIDWYMLGAFMYRIMVGKMPHVANDRNLLKKRILHDNVCFPNYLSA